MTDIQWQRLTSPIGELLLVGDDRALHSIYFDDDERRPVPGAGWQRGGPVVDAAAAQLTEYFDGVRTDFDVALAPNGTDFQRRVWDALRGIAYGETASYSEIARRIGNPNACRAVGLANGRNPIPVIVPCHRVVGADGTLTGYGGGLDRKQKLLELEGRILAA